MSQFWTILCPVTECYLSVLMSILWYHRTFHRQTLRPTGTLPTRWISFLRLSVIFIRDTTLVRIPDTLLFCRDPFWGEGVLVLLLWFHEQQDWICQQFLWAWWTVPTETWFCGTCYLLLWGVSSSNLCLPSVSKLLVCSSTIRPGAGLQVQCVMSSCTGVKDPMKPLPERARRDSHL